MSPSRPHPPSRSEVEAHRGLCRPLGPPASGPKVLRRCTLCDRESESHPDIALYCRHGGEWFLMVRVDGEEAPSTSRAI